MVLAAGGLPVNFHKLRVVNAVAERTGYSNQIHLRPLSTLATNGDFLRCFVICGGAFGY